MKNMIRFGVVFISACLLTACYEDSANYYSSGGYEGNYPHETTVGYNKDYQSAQRSSQSGGNYSSSQSQNNSSSSGTGSQYGSSVSNQRN